MNETASLTGDRYYIYMIKCKDDSLYTGITNDLDRRLHQHFSGKKSAAKYTLWKKPVQLEALWETEGKSSALKLEYQIKQLKRKDKLDLIGDNGCFVTLFKNQLDLFSYQRLDISKRKIELKLLYGEPSEKPMKP